MKKPCDYAQQIIELKEKLGYTNQEMADVFHIFEYDYLEFEWGNSAISDSAYEKMISKLESILNE